MVAAKFLEALFNEKFGGKDVKTKLALKKTVYKKMCENITSLFEVEVMCHLFLLEN